MSAKRASHGLCGSEPYTYRSWAAMKSRCDRSYTNRYENYGGSGVTYCDRWKDFENFFADMGRRPEGTTLDRFVDGWKPCDGVIHYGPDTCRWATPKQQAENRASTVLLTVDGVTQSVFAWSKQEGVAAETIRQRHAQGMSDKDCLKGRRTITWDGRTMGLIAWDREMGFKDGLLRKRLEQGCTVEQALTRKVGEGRRYTEQAHVIDHDGKQLTIAEWSRELGVSHEMIRSRIKRGWNEIDALTTPRKGRKS